MSDTTFPRTFPSGRLDATNENAPRRTPHGSSAWSLPSRFQSLRQPQDGALVNTAGSLRPIDGRTANTLVESEDARLNGSLRSLARRVKGLNVMARPMDASLIKSDHYFEPAPRKPAEIMRKTTRAIPARTQVA